MLLRIALLAAACSAIPTFAQLRLGVRGGVPITDLIETTGPIKPNFSRWTLGPMVELDLPAGVGVEFNALYRRVGVEPIDLSVIRPPFSTGPETTSSWEFPVLVKYKFKGGIARPYLAAGPSFRHISDIGGFFSNGSAGFAAAAGVRLNLFVLKVSPEIRYTRWLNDGLVISGPGPLSSKSNRDQLEFLVGITF